MKTQKTRQQLHEIRRHKYSTTWTYTKNRGGIRCSGIYYNL